MKPLNTDKTRTKRRYSLNWTTWLTCGLAIICSGRLLVLGGLCSGFLFSIKVLLRSWDAWVPFDHQADQPKKSIPSFHLLWIDSYPIQPSSVSRRREPSQNQNTSNPRAITLSSTFTVLEFQKRRLQQQHGANTLAIHSQEAWHQQEATTSTRQSIGASS